MRSPNKMSKEFRLFGGDDEFNSRNKSVFDQLSSLSPSPATPSVSVDDISRSSSSSRRSSSSHRRSQETTRQLRGQESLFKRPELPPPRWRGRQTPDHHKNPHKWTRYSLGDVSTDDMSDRTNTSTALSFLNELKKRKEGDAEEMDVDQLPHTVQFKKPVKRDLREKSPAEGSTEKQGPVFRGSKRVMPEYVVGQKSGKGSKKGGAHQLVDNKSKKLKLDHLLMDDDDEVDNDE